MELPARSEGRRDEPPGTVHLEVEGVNVLNLSPRPSADSDDPLNWSKRRKIIHVAILLFYCFLMFASNTATTPLFALERKDIKGYGAFVLDISFSANSATLAIGSLIIVPFASLIGRRSIYIFTALLMLGCDIWAAAASTTGDIIGSSIVQGIAGSVNEAIFQMTVIDLFFVHQRGRVNGLYLISSALGNFIGPVISGYLGKAAGWRWALYTIAILTGFVAVLIIFFLEESKFVPNSKTRRSTESPSGNVVELTVFPHEKNTRELEQNLAPSNQSIPVVDGSLTHTPYLQRLRLFTKSGSTNPTSFLQQLYRPFVILVTFPGIFLSAFVYGFFITAMNILAVTQTEIYPEPPYRFSSVGVGNLNIAPALGAVVGAAYGGVFADKAILVLARRNYGLYEPEMRLWLFILPAASMSAGILMYGLSVAQGLPWYIGSVGGGFMGFGLGGGGDLLISYIQDSYAEIIGPAFIGPVFLVNMMGFVLLLLLDIWQSAMGTYEMFALLGGLSVAVNLMVLPVVIWGKIWRGRFAGRYRRLAEE